MKLHGEQQDKKLTLWHQHLLISAGFFCSSSEELEVLALVLLYTNVAKKYSISNKISTNDFRISIFNHIVNILDLNF